MDHSEEIKKIDQEINRLETRKSQLKAKIDKSYDVLEKLSTGDYEVYYKDELNDGYYDVLSMGTIITDGTKEASNRFKTFDNSTGPGFIKIGPVTIGKYEEAPDGMDFLAMLMGQDTGQKVDKILVGTFQDTIAIKVDKNLKIRKKFKFDDKDDGLGF